MPYHAIQKQVVYDVFRRCRDTVLLKLYPTLRYVDGDPFASLLTLPENCRVDQFIDLRNIRAGADVWVLDTPGSSLNWVWPTGVPIIYLETGMYTLLPEIRELFEAAMFYVDVRDLGWRSRLLRLLRLPHDELVAQYEAKADARQLVGEYGIVGPAGNPGADAAQFILGSA